MTDHGKPQAPEVPARATQGAEAVAGGSDRPWAEAGVWTERMLSALVNGVKGGNAYFAQASLFALHTAWQTARQPR